MTAIDIGRVMAVVRKELRDYRRKRSIVVGMLILPAIFLTTHRLDEAEKLCDRVAILNTTLRTVGRPSELRERLFTSALVIRTVAPLRDPGDLFKRVATVESWRSDDSGAYVLAVSNPTVAAPELTRVLVGAGADVLSISEAKHSLEDVYLELVRSDVEAGKR